MPKRRLMARRKKVDDNMRELIWPTLAVFVLAENVNSQEIEPIAVPIQLHYVMLNTFDSMGWGVSWEDDPKILGTFIRKCIIDQYSSKGTSAGYFVGEIIPDNTLNGLDGVRIRVIVPSEVFRDSFSEWDQFEVVAAVDPGPTAAEVVGTLWLLPMNYLRRDRGGISVGPEPSPDWEFKALPDYDSTNGRLRSIQAGIQRQIDRIRTQ
jgi:hypothetical protein